MPFADLVRRRRMVRRFALDRPVSRDVIRDLVDLGTRAPSAGFSQGWQFVVLDRPDDLDLYWNLTAGAGDSAGRADDAWLTGMRTAPVLVLLFSDPLRYRDRYAAPDKTHSSLAVPADTPIDGADGVIARWPVPWWDVDTGMAALIMLIGATEQGLGGCLFGVPAAAIARVRAGFQIDPGWHPVGAIALGHPVDQTEEETTGRNRGQRPGRRRRPLDEVVRFGRAAYPPE